MNIKRKRRCENPRGSQSEYHTWLQIKGRTTNPNNVSYAYYGGRGIGMCESWRNSYEAFLADMGPRPSRKHSIDRIKNDLGYSRDNCKWSTAEEQNSNRRTNIKLTLNGRTLTATQWSRELMVSRTAICHRLQKLGWTEERVLTTPFRRFHRSKINS